MKKSSEFLNKIGFGSNLSSGKLEVKSDGVDEGHSSVPRKRLKRNFSPNGISKPSITETEMDRMKVAINIALEVFSKGLSISPAQLEESVSAFYKHDFKKSIPQEDIHTFETLTRDDIMLLMDNFDHLNESEQKNFAKYLNMLRRIDHAIINELRGDKKTSESFIKIISHAL